MQVINLFGGPGTGKSTCASELFAIMKKQHMNVELVTEFAKDCVWEEHHNAFSDQLYILANQNHRLHRLIGKVDYVITDSPLLMNLAYAEDYLMPHYPLLLKTLWNEYSNTNILLKRNGEYQQIGRNQTEEEAKKIDEQIEKILYGNTVITFPVTGSIAKEIFTLLYDNGYFGK